MFGTEEAHRPHPAGQQTVDDVDELRIHAGGMAKHAHPPAPAQIKPFSTKHVETRSDDHSCPSPPALWPPSHLCVLSGR